MMSRDKRLDDEVNEQLKQENDMSLKDLPDINLLPPYQREGRRLYYLFIFLLICLLIAYVYIGYDYFTTKSHLSDVDDEYAILSDEYDELEERVNQKQAEESNLADAVAFVENYNMPAAIFIEELNDLIPDNNYLSEYQYSSQEAQIVTHFESLDLISRYTTDLLAFNYVQDVKVDQINTIELKDEDELESFSIIPRYEADFSLQIDKHELKKGATEADE